MCMCLSVWGNVKVASCISMMFSVFSPAIFVGSELFLSCMSPHLSHPIRSQHAELINTVAQQMVKWRLFIMKGMNTKPPDNRNQWLLPLRETTESVDIVEILHSKSDSNNLHWKSVFALLVSLRFLFLMLPDGKLLNWNIIFPLYWRELYLFMCADGILYLLQLEYGR